MEATAITLLIYGVRSIRITILIGKQQLVGGYIYIGGRLYSGPIVCTPGYCKARRRFSSHRWRVTPYFADRDSVRSTDRWPDIALRSNRNLIRLWGSLERQGESLASRPCIGLVAILQVNSSATRANRAWKPCGTVFLRRCTEYHGPDDDGAT